MLLCEYDFSLYTLLVGSMEQKQYSHVIKLVTAGTHSTGHIALVHVYFVLFTSPCRVQMHGRQSIPL